MKILFVGDVMLGRLVNQALKKLPPEYPFGNTLPIFKEADVRICNLECVISNMGNPWSITPKVFHFRTDEKNIATLKAAEIDVVSIANNHVLDYDYDGLLRMLTLLNENHFHFSGAGINFEAATAPTFINIHSHKIGFIAFTDNEAGWEATEDRPGIFYCPIDEKDERAKYLFEVISQTKNKVDTLIVSAHWGPNWGYEPPLEQIPFAHHLIDAGADIIFGHSGHIFRGIEFYKNKAIIYCAGDFIDDYAVDEVEKNDESFIFVLELQNNTTRLLLYPTHIKNFQANFATGNRKKMLVRKMQELCSQMGSDSSWNNELNCLEVLRSDFEKDLMI